MEITCTVHDIWYNLWYAWNLSKCTRMAYTTSFAEVLLCGFIKLQTHERSDSLKYDNSRQVFLMNYTRGIHFKNRPESAPLRQTTFDFHNGIYTFVFCLLHSIKTPFTCLPSRHIDTTYHLSNVSFLPLCVGITTMPWITYSTPKEIAIIT